MRASGSDRKKSSAEQSSSSLSAVMRQTSRHFSVSKRISMSNSRPSMISEFLPHRLTMHKSQPSAEASTGGTIEMSGVVPAEPAVSTPTLQKIISPAKNDSPLGRSSFNRGTPNESSLGRSSIHPAQTPTPSSIRERALSMESVGSGGDGPANALPHGSSKVLSTNVSSGKHTGDSTKFIKRPRASMFVRGGSSRDRSASEMSVHEDEGSQSNAKSTASVGPVRVAPAPQPAMTVAQTAAARKASTHEIIDRLRLDTVTVLSGTEGEFDGHPSSKHIVIEESGGRTITLDVDESSFTNGRRRSSFLGSGMKVHTAVPTTAHRQSLKLTTNEKNDFLKFVESQSVVAPAAAMHDGKSKAKSTSNNSNTSGTSGHIVESFHSSHHSHHSMPHQSQQLEEEEMIEVLPTTITSNYLKKKYQEMMESMDPTLVTRLPTEEPVQNGGLNAADPPPPRPPRYFLCGSSINPMQPPEEVLSQDFSDVFIFSHPGYFYRAVEIAIILNCLYMSFWVTNFITIVTAHSQNPVVWNIYMLIPIVLAFLCIGNLAKVCALIDAITNVDGHLEVIGKVLEESIEMDTLVTELREKILSKMVEFDDILMKQRMLCSIFFEIDQDRSESIDRFEFRDLLRKLGLKYSDISFKRLFKAVDVNGDGSIELSDFGRVVFPTLDELTVDALNVQDEQSDADSDDDNNDKSGEAGSDQTAEYSGSTSGRGSAAALREAESVGLDGVDSSSRAASGRVTRLANIEDCDDDETKSQ